MRLRPALAALAVASSAAACAPVPRAEAPAAPLDRRALEQEVARVLDDVHDAAAHSDEPRYFAHYAPDAVFLGTDATERWDVAALRAYAHPRFSVGKGWKMHATRRTVAFSADGKLAWFEEDLLGEKLGPARGSGVLARIGGEWKVEQYNLALVVPNERFAEVRALLDKPPAK